MLDGDIITPSEGEAMVMRRRLSFAGVVSVAVDRKGKAVVSAIGLPLDEDYDAFVAEAQRDISEALAKARKHERADRIEVARLAARRAANRWSGKKPQVQVLLQED